ncbi:hypothetical protein LX32DRAFT_647912 [Colletotrichum zoysiae]|uniref:Uncharacterized protein n=1 Tax=Colletotrichum zoysiae TaxID=1216348 RepID=A0AAD9HU42_9PEZI|nr:hypothetical protein LX32DRAFT_647912 [Colletotrichum zoysiae]
MEPIINKQRSTNTTQPTSPEQTAISSHFSFCFNLPSRVFTPADLPFAKSFVSDEVEATATIEYIEKQKPRGAVHPEYLAHLCRYSKKRVEVCDKTLAALARASQHSARQGVLGPGQQAPRIAILEEYCESNKKLWEKLRGLVEA